MAYPAFMASIGSLVMGSSTYRWLLENQEAWAYSQPAWVFTHRELPIPEGADVRFVKGMPRDWFAQIKTSAEGNGIWIMGGGDLAAQFARDGLLDEVWIQFAPVMLGSGQPLFTGSVDLELLDVARNRDFVCTRYGVVGHH